MAFLRLGLILFLSGFLCTISFADENRRIITEFENSLFDTVKGDFVNYYSFDNLKVLAGSFAIGGILANTNTDRNLQNSYQDNIRSNGSNDFFKFSKNLGETKYVIPIALAAAMAGYFIPESSNVSPIGVWGFKASRAYLVGVPPMLLMKSVTGASRPGESSQGSDWQPFNDINGVSGHSFFGAVPFITLAKMYKKTPAKWLFYGASFLAGLSRINDNDHYFSQSALGWVMAYQSVGAVFLTDKEQENPLSFNIYPYGRNGAGLLLSYSW